MPLPPLFLVRRVRRPVSVGMSLFVTLALSWLCVYVCVRACVCDMNPDGTGARVGPPTNHESQWLLSDTDLASQYPLGAQAGDEDTDTDTDTPPSLATVVPGSSGEPLSGTGEWSS